MKRYWWFIFIFSIAFYLSPHLSALEIDILESNDLNYEARIEHKVGNLELVYIEDYCLRLNNNIIHSLNNENNISIILYNNKYLVSSIKNNKLYLRTLNLKGEVLKEDYLSENIISNNYEIKRHQDYFFLITCLSDYTDAKIINKRKAYHLNKDSIIIKFSEDFEIIDFKIIGGRLNEEFFKLEIKNDLIYIAGIKDALTGGDLGNGGLNHYDNLFVICLDLDFNIHQIEVYNITSQNISAFFFVDEFLYIVGDLFVIKLNNDLKFINMIGVNSIIDYSINDSEHLIIFLNNNIEVIAFKEFKNVCSYEYNNKDILRVIDERIVSYKLSDKSYNYIDIYFIENNIDRICRLDYCPLPQDQVKVKNIFKNLELQDISSEPYFDRLIHGDYIFNLEFLVADDLVYNLKSNLTVYPECNIRNNKSYPLGYNLLFTGYATLNGQTVYNNYYLEHEGVYELILKDNLGQESLYNFKVEKNVVNFYEYLVSSWDLVVLKNSDINLKLEIKDKNKRIVKVKVNGEELDSVIVDEDNNYLLKIKSPSTSGLYHYEIQEFIYEDGIIESVNRVYLVNVLRDSLDVVVSPQDDLKFNLVINDFENTLRYLELVVIQNSNEERLIYNLDNTNLFVSGLVKGSNALIEINLVSDLGDEKLEIINLFKLDIIPKDHDISLGHLKINRKSSSLEELSLELGHNKSFYLQNINYNNQDYLYHYQKKSIAYYLLMFVVLISGLGSGYYFKKKYK